MPIERESGIEFNFNAASSVVNHDKTLPGGEGNTMWKGVDFRIEDPTAGSLWIEVKSWDPQRVDPARRGGNQRRFTSEMRSKPFAAEIRSKFYGTTAFLAWTGGFVPSNVTFVVLLQPPRSIDKALLGALTSRMNSAFPAHHALWTHNLSIAIVDVSDWNMLYPNLPARIL